MIKVIEKTRQIEFDLRKKSDKNIWDNLKYLAKLTQRKKESIENGVGRVMGVMISHHLPTLTEELLRAVVSQGVTGNELEQVKELNNRCKERDEKNTQENKELLEIFEILKKPKEATP